MPIPNRAIPQLSREVYRRVTPNWALLEAMEKMSLKYPLQQDFVQRMKAQKGLSSEQLIESQSNPTGFEFPLGKTESLPFHISRTTSGSLPIFTDYRFGFFFCIVAQIIFIITIEMVEIVYLLF